MPNHKSAEKRVRQNDKRRLRNRAVMVATRTYIKQARAAIDGGDTTKINEALARAVKAIDSAASKGVMHRNQASRKVSRLTIAANKVING
jgi:small subunit ribosomal protein S20